MTFEPQGKYAWDLWFAHDGNNQHIFYLQADKLACHNDPEKRHGLSTVGHSIIRDGKISNQSQKPVFEASTTSNTWDNLSIWTGSIIKDERLNKHLLFYTSRCKEDEPQSVPNEKIQPQNIGLATSSDLLNWQRHPASIESPLIPNPGKAKHLDGITWRDPYLIKIDKMYHCLVTARLTPNTKYGIELEEEGGCIVALSSMNLYDWSQSKPQILVASNHFTQMEVPQLLYKSDGKNKTYYLIFCAQVKDITNRRKAEVPDDQCLSGTYVMQANPLPIDSDQLPNFDSSVAKILSPGLYAGRIINPQDKQHEIYGFKIDPLGGTYLGGIYNRSIDPDQIM